MDEVLHVPSGKTIRIRKQKNMVQGNLILNGFEGIENISGYPSGIITRGYGCQFLQMNSVNCLE